MSYQQNTEANTLPLSAIKSAIKSGIKKAIKSGSNPTLIDNFLFNGQLFDDSELSNHAELYT